MLDHYAQARPTPPHPTLLSKPLAGNVASLSGISSRYPLSAAAELQDGLLGFRGIPASIVGVAEAMAKAYPLLVGPALERAKASAGPGEARSLEDAWLREVGRLIDRRRGNLEQTEAPGN